MENQNMMPNGSQNPMSPMGQPAPIGETKSVGALIGSIIIVIILIIGGLYLWSAKVAPVSEPSVVEQAPISASDILTAEEQALSQPDPVASQMAAVSTSDDVAAIDADLKATSLDNLDSALQAQ